MARDRFFDAKYCHRCGDPLNGGRIMSWFNDDTICTSKCAKAEDELKKALVEKGDKTNYEGCGYIPKL